MHRQKSWILLLIVALLSTAAMAQTGSISGSVTDPSGAALHTFGSQPEILRQTPFVL